MLGQLLPYLVKESIQRGQLCVVQGPFAELVDKLRVARMNGRHKDDPDLNPSHED